MENKYSALPWNHKVETKTSYHSQTGEKREDTSHWIYSSDDKFVCITNNYSNGDTNADHIVKAVNMHDRLIEVLELSLITVCLSRL